MNAAASPAMHTVDTAIALPPLRVTDAEKFGRVAVLMGGDSSEREVSLNSGNNVLQALQSRGVNAHAVDGIAALLAEIRDEKVDRVFNILHGGNGENGVLQGLLTALKLPCTGSGVLGSALSMDKIRTKQVWLSLGLPTPAYVRLSKGSKVLEAAEKIGYPLIVKPSQEGSSVGVSRVQNVSGLDAAITLARHCPGELLMEQMIVGDELTVAILGDVALPSIHIIPKGWYDYQAKYIADDTQYLCPGLQGDDENEIRRLALAAFQSAGCSGWGRVDLMRDRNTGKFYLLEVNTAPGMTSHSLVPKAAAQIGIGFAELCWRILEQTV
jgi:D-alanine-D-alanine ligase